MKNVNPIGSNAAKNSVTAAVNSQDFYVSEDSKTDYERDLAHRGGDECTDISFLFSVVEGTRNSEVLLGTEDNDYIQAYEGSDLIIAGAGSDLAYGGEGNDTIRGGDGRDHLYGGEGDDELLGGECDDTLYGDEGNDTLHGGSGNDAIYAGTGFDWVYAGEGDDLIVNDAIGQNTAAGPRPGIVVFAEDGNDFIDVTAGLVRNTIIDAGAGDDTVLGGGFINTSNGDDIVMLYPINDPTVIGEESGVNLGSGSDTAIGSDADENFFGMEGDDILHGGGGNDLFYFFGIGNAEAPTGGHDVIVDFSVGDKIMLAKFGYSGEVAPLESEAPGIPMLDLLAGSEVFIDIINESAEGTLLAYNNGEIFLQDIQLTQVDFSFLNNDPYAWTLELV